MIYGIVFSFIGYVFTRILMEDLLISYQRWLHTLPDWLGKPLGLCPVCFTGQLTFWGMLPLLRFDYLTIIMYLGTISINMIIVKTLEYVFKED
jgi:uncharacterized membrane protein